MSGSTVDTVAGLTLRQPVEGYRFSMDPVLLSAFVTSTSPKTIADLAAGSGIIGLLLARRYARAHVTLVEMDPALYGDCLHNIELNGLDERVDALNLDVRRTVGQLEALDLVVSNPPFRAPGTGRISKKGEGQRASARHELDLPLDELCRAAARMLRGRGKFCLVYHPERLLELVDSLREARLEPKRMRFVHGRLGSEARILLMEAVRDGRPGLKVEPPLYIYEQGSQEYTPEVRAMYAPDDRGSG